MHNKLSEIQLVGISQLAYDIINDRNIKKYNKKKITEMLRPYKFSELEYNFCLLRCKIEIDKLNQSSIEHEQKRLFNFN